MDEADYASERETQLRQAALDEVAHKAQQDKARPFTGKCEYCGDPVAGLVRYCGQDCSDDARWREESLRRRGCL